MQAYKKWREVNGAEEKLPGLSFNNDQLFFIGYAQVCSYSQEFKSYSL
jgi:hypothetical protein